LTYTDTGQNMITLREENIGFGGSDQDTNIQPYPPKGSINLDPLLAEARKLRDAAKQQEAVSSSMKHTISKDPYNKDRGLSVSEKNFQETKKLIENVSEKIANYPKYMSYEGSMVVCVMLSLHREVDVPLNSLPQIDQALIKEIVGNDYGMEIKSIHVRFDKEKDFFCSLTYADKLDKRFTLFNTVAHPRPEDLKDTNQGTVPVEAKENTINLGVGTLVFNKKRLANLAAVPQKSDSWKQSEMPDPTQVIKTTNKNAYEIRADVLHMAIDWAKVENSVTGVYVKPTDDQLLDLAKKFYSFVENRR